MLSNKMKIAAAVLLSQTMLVGAASAGHSENWSYVGVNGPDKWSELDEAFEKCREGITQSPINLETKKLASNKDPIIFHYEPYAISPKTFGVKVSSNASNKYIEVGDKIYNLVQFHFHMPGEHSINGKTSPAELHFVHQDADGNLAVVGVMIEEGKSNPMIKYIVDSAGNQQQKYAVESSDITNLLPVDRSYFRYMGSLTTPPCTEGVNWHVLKTPIEASKEEIAALAKTMPSSGTARPIQPKNNRTVK